MATGTVKSFNRSKGYGFIRMDSGGKDVFVHLSAVQEAGLADLRKGQKLSFEMFDNRGKAAAKNLRVSSRTTKGAAEHKLVSIQSRVTQNARCEMSKSELQQLKAKRTSVSRAALELAIAEAVRASDPQCDGLVEIFVEQIFPTSPDDSNWAIKGVKYGRAERDRCNAAISDFVKEGQREFEVSDFSK